MAPDHERTWSPCGPSRTSTGVYGAIRPCTCFMCNRNVELNALNVTSNVELVTSTERRRRIRYDEDNL
ncbi:hypothetical protein DPMN_022540 [Dreissena polymorpha]|uniref:Uncharacterized protein n=1 Tax=Dreissena polymorpha TaxID=45954 RepID=A0A9D4NKJ3_DREPO|nr:hypothetical protein DPMN_022540 [Dreissena polymorpha]